MMMMMMTTTTTMNETIQRAQIPDKAARDHYLYIAQIHSLESAIR